MKKLISEIFLSNKEIIFYKDIDDLSYKLNKYKKNIKERKMIAKNGKNSYFKHFNSTIVSDYILSKTIEYKSKNNFLGQINMKLINTKI